MNGQHHYQTTITWTGNKGTGTSHYKSYERNHTITIDNKTEILGSSIVTVTDVSMIDKANELHKKANKLCFIANSVNFPVKHQPTAKVIMWLK